MPRRNSPRRAAVETEAPARRFTVAGASFPVPPLAPGLYVVATPIGHLDDISLRALKVLAAADLVVCEDSRVTRKLLAAYGITTRLAAYHEHNAARVRPGLVARLAQGDRLALVSDAGTPLVSDPGYRLVGAAIAAGVPVVPVPGASAPLAALSVSGLPSDRFFFEGFLPAKRVARRNRLARLKAVPATLIIFESPRRLAAALADMADMLGPRPAAVGRELTKRFEEMRRGPLDELARAYAETAPKGEIVIVVGPSGESEGVSETDLDALLADLLAAASVRDAAEAAAAQLGIARRRAYARALELARAGRDGPA